MGSDRHSAADLPDCVDVAIVGGGISGLYCALQLARLIKEQPSLHLGSARIETASLEPMPVHVFEASGRLGGRIETWDVKLTPGPNGEVFRAEFGPMRIEPRDQPLLKDLLDYLGIREPHGEPESDFDLTLFSAYAAEEPLQPKFTLQGEEGEQSSLLDLLLLAIRRICELVAEDNQQIPADTHRDAARYWRQFLGGSSVRRRYWKGELRAWIMNLVTRTTITSGATSGSTASACATWGSGICSARC